MKIQRKYVPGKDPEVGVRLGFIRFGKESSVAGAGRTGKRHRR